MAIVISGMCTAIQQSAGAKAYVLIRGSGFSTKTPPVVSAMPSWLSVNVKVLSDTHIWMEFTYVVTANAPKVPVPVSDVSLTLTSDDGNQTAVATVEVDVFT